MDLDGQDEGINITDLVYKSVQQIQGNKVLKNEFFHLLEGTRTLEVNNTRLDTGLISILEKELSFDTRQPQPIEVVLRIIDKLLISYSSWLNNSSLPLTVLSCRYVQTILENYKASPEQYFTLNACNFKIARFEKQNNYDTDSIDYHLVNKVLKSAVIGICKFIGFCLHVSENVLYEEEDLITRSMEHDFLFRVPIDLVIMDIKESKKWVEKNIHGNQKDTLIDYLQFIIHLVSIPSILDISITMYGKNTDLPSKTTFLNEGIKILNQIKKCESGEVPEGVFSKFIQVDADNRNIPAELYLIDKGEAYEMLENILEVIRSFVLKSGSIRNVNHLLNILKFEIGEKVNNFSAISRGFFQLYLIRDNKTIFGSQEVLNSLTIKMIENVIGPDTILFNPDYWSIDGTDEYIQGTKDNILQKLNMLLGDFEMSSYQELSIPGNNRCRQRQLMTRLLLICDSLQANFEALEVSIWEDYKIGNQLMNESMGLAVSSYIFYSKVDLMLEVALTGFELELYKDFEFCLMYWYISYLAQVLADHVSSRINGIVELKINQITVGLSKKIKKQKAGPKKNKLKEIQKFKTEVVLPQLENTLNYNNKYHVPRLTAMSILCEAIRMYLILLSSYGLIDFKGPKNCATTPELLFGHRMKSWSSIGAPELPTYAQYKKSIDTSYLTSKETKMTMIKIIIEKFKNSENLYHEICNNLQDPTLESSFIDTSVAEWYFSLLETCQMYTKEVKQFSALILLGGLNESNSSKFKAVSTGDMSHKYFPIVSVIGI